MGADTSAAESALSGMGSKVQSAGKAMAGMGMAMTAGITAPIVAGFAAAVSSAADFEQSLNVLAAVTDAPAEAMQMLTDQALELGATTVFSANEAAEAMLELGKAGMSTAEIGEAIGGVMDLAAAGGMELADAAGITSAALQTFGLDASESAYVANSLAAAANASSASMQDLGYGIRNAGAVMAASGVDIDTLNTLMAILTNHGLEASDAATSLKTMHMRLTAPTAKASKVMQQLGINVFDSAGNMRDYRDIIGDMTAATEGMSDEMQSMAFETVFGADAIRAANIVVQEGVEGYDEMTAAVKEQGASQRAAAAQTKGFSGAMERLGGSIDTLAKRAVLPWLDSLTGLVDMVGSAIDAVGDFSPAILNLGLAFGAALAAAGPLLLIGGKLAAMFAAMNPVVLAVTAAIALLAAAWATDFMGIQGAAQTAWDTVSGFFTAIPGQAQTMATAVQTAFDKTTFPTLEELWADFQEGDFATLAEKITTTAYDLMVNLDAELGISAQANGLAQILVDAVNGVANAIAAVDWSAKQTEIALHMTTLRDNVYSSLTTAITAVPWTTVGTTIQTKIDELTTTINGFTLDIDWKAFLTAIIVTPIKLAVAGLTWVFSGDDFKTFQDAVNDAIRDLGWTDIAASLAKLGTAIKNQLILLVWDIAADFGIDMDAVVVDFKTVAESWKKGFDAALITYAPAFAYISGIWSKVFGNNLGTATEKESVNFSTTATNWGSLLITDLQATAMDFGPWSIKVMAEATAEMERTDATPVGRAIGKSIVAAVTSVLGGALMAHEFLIGFGKWIDEVDKQLSQAWTEGMAEGGWTRTFLDLLAEFGREAEEIITGIFQELSIAFNATPLGQFLIEANAQLEQWITDAGIWADTTHATLMEWVARAESWINTADTQLTAWLTRADAWAQMANTQLTAWLNEATGWVTFVKTTLEGWLVQAGIWAALAALAFGLWLAGVQQWATDLYTKLSEWLTGVKQWATDLGTTLGDWYTNVDGWIKLVSQAFQAFVDQAGKWITNVGTTLMDWHNHAMAWILNVGATLKSWMDRAIKWLADLFTTPEWLNTLIDWTPGWVQTLLNWSPTVKVEQPEVDEPPAEASGTPYAKGGMTWVGEHGPELVNLPRGSQVWSHAKSMDMAAAGAGIQIGAVHIHNDMDVEVLAATIARRIAQGGRR